MAPIYGGQDYRVQLRALDRGAHVIVGTPGRVMDHIRRETLGLDSMKMVVLDEGDEMLKMGFVDDIAWILDQINHEHQTALFSATMPTAIQKISKRYMKDAEKVLVKAKSSVVDTIEQCYICVEKNKKIEALTRFLEVEDIQAAIVFVRTKNASAELADKLQARGHSAAALNGDMNQTKREKVLGRLRKASLTIVVATDVAARGIDVEHISHVLNFDAPYDVDSYVHRIGRTGRAGRKGKAVLFVTPREGRVLKDIERATQKEIKRIDPPSLQEMTERRDQQLSDEIAGLMGNEKKLKASYKLLDSLLEKTALSPRDIAAALAYLLQKSKPLPCEEIETSLDLSEPRSKRSSSRRKPSSSGRRQSSSSSRRKPSDGRRSKSSSYERDDAAGERRRKPSDGRRSKPSDGRRSKSSSYERDDAAGERRRKPSDGRRSKPSDGRRSKSSSYERDDAAGERRRKPSDGRRSKPSDGRRSKSSSYERDDAAGERRRKPSDARRKKASSSERTESGGRRKKPSDHRKPSSTTRKKTSTSSRKRPSSPLGRNKKRPSAVAKKHAGKRKVRA